MAEPGFTGASLDRADHLRLDAERMADMMANGDARLLDLAELDPVLEPEGTLHWTSFAEAHVDETIFLGIRDGVPLFAPLVRTRALGRRSWNVMRLIDRMSPRDAAIWGAARSLNEWHNKHRFCGVCGTATETFRAGWGRQCPSCGAEHFPRVDPVVIMLAEHDGRVLVARQHQYPPGRYSALAGFVEPGESIEEAVARELMEEAGLAVRDVAYVASQPWPFPGSLMIACLAKADTDAIVLESNELEDGFWVDRAGVRAALAGAPDAPFQAPPPFAIANTLLTRWVEGREEGERG
ncbi:MAG: NAD(+) diphosphatase [Sphingomonas sp.]|nr:NAD(+) diphosphatase [Sphingomonas sp.]